MQQPGRGHLAENVLHFARVLRSAGMTVATDRVMLALRALQVTGLAGRDDFHATLSACLLDRRAHQPLFDQAFELFWQGPDLLRRLQALAPPPAEATTDAAPPPQVVHRRLADALFAPPPGAPPPPAPPGRDEPQPSWSARERLQQADFSTMGADEWRQAQRLLAQLRLAYPPLRTRRSRPAARPGQADWRATLQAMARGGGELAAPRWRQPRTRPMPLVVLADISGSMRRYSRMLLHFAHGLGQASRQGGARVESFVFGTRLTRTTRLLAGRDPDIAVAQVAQAVQDWSGGTRISACLHEFNQHWARRVLGNGATVLLISDGLEHGDTDALAAEMARLRRSCRRLVWLNPLLRFAGFEPRAAGIRAMLPQVHHFVPAHNLASLAQLVQLLGQAQATPPRPVAANRGWR